MSGSTPAIPPPSASEISPETKRWLVERARTATPWIRVAVGCGFAEGLVTIAQAYLVAQAVAGAFLHGDGVDSLAATLTWLAVAIVLRAGLAWGRDAAGGRAGERLRDALRRDLAERVLSRGARRFGGRRPGEMVTAAIEQVEALDDYASLYLPQRMLAGLVPAAILLAVVPDSWVAGLILVGTAPVVPIFAWLIGLGAARASQRQFQALGRLGSLFLDRLRGLATLKILDRISGETQTIATSTDAYRRRTMKVLRMAFLSSAVLELFSALGVAMMAVYLGFTLLQHWDFGYWGRTLSFETALRLLVLSADFYLPLRALGTLHHARAGALGASEILREVFEELESESEDDDPREPPSGIEILLDDVSVSTDAAAAPILDGLSLRVRAGERIAIVGPSGSGKSTVLDVVLGLVRPGSGRALLGGVDLDRLDLEAWRRELSWVGQQPALFHGTLRSNILFGRPDAPSEEVEAAARAARVYEFARELPAGLDAPIGEGGVGLSGGQIQRVALARAYLAGGSLLLLDEPTANLDTENERMVLEALRDLVEGRTVVMVTHRLAPCRLADRVIRVEGGRVVDEGETEKMLERLVRRSTDA